MTAEKDQPSTISKDAYQEDYDEMMNCQHDFYGDDPKRDINRPDKALEQKFCVKCGQHYITIVNSQSAKIKHLQRVLQDFELMSFKDRLRFLFSSKGR